MRQVSRKRLIIFPLLLIFMAGLSACEDKNDTTFGSGPYLNAGPVSIALISDSDGNIVLSSTYSQKIIGINYIGAGWQVGFEHVLYKAKRENYSLFIVWEDYDGNSWEKQYKIGKPFKVTFTDKELIKTIESDNNGNIIIVVKSRMNAPGYNDLREDIRRLIERWDLIHHHADHYLETSELDTVLRGDALQDQINAIETLKRKNCYWNIYELIPPRIVRFDVINTKLLVVEVEKKWDMDLFCNNTKVLDKDGWFIAKYTIEKIDQQWFITKKQVVY